ncbi:50S ribosomal protein L13 [candidate division WOR-3 bacterium]|jgi:large subunit ribosomal protein L13|nr:50S ribosomal protein L13 [candidate division WOR-3 bacterium]
MKTYVAKKENIERKWYVIDAKDKVLGRLAVQIADILRGKNKVIYTPHVDTGDFVVVINTDKLHFTGDKLNQKTYHSHSGFIGNAKSVVLKMMMKKHSDRVLRHAVRGMIPKNKLGRKMLKKLKVYKQNEHPHQAQTPEQIS